MAQRPPATARRQGHPRTRRSASGRPFTYLDPDHLAAGGRRHDSITIGDNTKPAYEPRIAIITEHNDTALFFPSLPGGIAVHGGGFASSGTLPLLLVLTQVPISSTGTTFAVAGYEVLHRLRGNGLSVRAVEALDGPDGYVLPDGLRPDWPESRTGGPSRDGAASGTDGDELSAVSRRTWRSRKLQPLRDSGV